MNKPVVQQPELGQIDVEMLEVLMSKQLGDDHSSAAYGYLAFSISLPCWLM